MFDIQLSKTVVNKQDFSKVVGSSFSTFQEPQPEELIGVDEFFQEYDRLFFDIPVDGATNSHSYLAQRSGEYSNFEKDTTDIQPLLDEIANLREQLIEANNTIIELESRV